MKFSQPLVLLLGAVLSASHLGCAAVTAVVSDTRPAARPGKGSAERTAAIARVFENQGRYDQAEVMYRKALRYNPNNAVVRQQLAAVTAKRTGRTISAEPTKQAIAAVDSIVTPKKQQGTSTETTTSDVNAVPTVPAALQSPMEVVSSYTDNSGLAEHPSPLPELKELTTAELDSTSDSAFEVTEQITELSASHSIPQPSSPPDVNVGDFSPIEYAVGSNQIAASPILNVVSEKVTQVSTVKTVRVTADEILSVAMAPADNVSILIRGLSHGDSLETQCLAAMLLGDCPREDQTVREILSKASKSAVDARLRQALCDSRIQRGEQDESTAEVLIQLIDGAPMDVRIQACASLYYFSGTSVEAQSIACLERQLSNDNHELRTSAALALGDFPVLSPQAIHQLKLQSALDANVEAQKAAKLSLERHECRSADKHHVISVLPAGK